ncbi:MAG: transglutaminase family protein [Ktedonobacteraceae bacterium]|nr:transglutaminase family protein [Ktedonobacteraceae bacterium]
MYYTVRHTTKFRYSAPISESMMEVRIQPRSEGPQRCLDFRLKTSPAAQIFNYRGENGNRVHHFDVPNRHNHLTITAETIVELFSPPPLPEALTPTAWDELDTLTADDAYWDTLHPSHFTHPTELLASLIAELQIERRDDPLTVVKDINTAVYTTFEYAKQNTRVDSPIDDALRIRRGVCQDFAHIMIALVRSLGIPCRYVSGYLFHQREHTGRSADGATHAWVEVFLPGYGWVGFDPTNNMLAGDRHIRVAIGRDYADVPPTHGIFRGKAESELSVIVRIYPTELPPPSADLSLEADWVPASQEGYELEEGSSFHQDAQQQQ